MSEEKEYKLTNEHIWILLHDIKRQIQNLEREKSKFYENEAYVLYCEYKITKYREMLDIFEVNNEENE